jgi:drug/metabolite transporter (DMT)-like permease
VIAAMMAIGLVITGPIAAAEGVPAHLHGSAWLWLLLSGGGNIVGLQLIYMAYRTGQVALVVPISSTEGAVAAVISIAAGESIGVGTGIALVLAVVGVCVTSLPADLPEGHIETPHVRTLLLAGGAALVFGVSLYATGRAAALLPSAWVVLSARVVGTVVLALPFALRGRLKLTRRALPFVIASAIAEVVGFFSYNLGTRHGIAVAAVIASQFAAIVVAFAYFFFHERLTRTQFIGICTIIVGVTLLSAVSA